MSITAGRMAVAISFVIAAGFSTASIWRQPDESPGMAMLFAAAFLPIHWIAATVAWTASRGEALDARGRQAWKLIAAASALFGISNILFFVSRHVTAYPGQDLLTLMMIPGLWFLAMFAGLARLPRRVETPLERATFWIDIATVVLSGILILVYVFAHTPGVSSTASLFGAVTTIGVPAMNGAVIFAALVVLLRPAHGISREAVGLLAGGVALLVVGDLAFARAQAANGHHGNIWYEPLYLVSASLSVAAAQMQRERPGQARPRQFDIVSIQSSVLPYIAVIAAVFVVILEVGNPWHSTLGRMVIGAGLLTGLVMGRQLIARRYFVQLAAAEQARLSRQGALEMKLQQAQKLEAVGLLAGGIAHDFNNILLAIRGTAELAALSPANLEEDLKAIMRSADHGTSLTRQLLAFSRRDAIQVQRFDLRDAVRGVESMLRRLLTSRVDFRVSLGPADIPVEMDRGQLEQVLVNLAINARDAMPEGGTLSIDVGSRRLATPADGLGAGEYARLTVSDTGHGMPPEVISRMFEPFYTTKPRGRGSGLGLSTVYAIVTRAGGTINVMSDIGRGTTMEVLIPRSIMPVVDDAMAVTPSLPGDEEHRVSRECVLVVDDDGAVRDVVANFLSRAGYAVTTASGGTEALAHLASGAPVDLLLTDLVMPGMSGRELTERARELDADLRIICMSGHAGPDATPASALVSAANFIEKPFALPTLGRLVRSVLDAPAGTDRRSDAHRQVAPTLKP